jgi:flagellar assembly factor FliW
MLFETTRFGPIGIEPDSIITFTQPIIGFQEYRRYVLLPGPENSALRWLQSTDSGELAFIVMNPFTVAPDYRIDLQSQEMAELAVTSISELDIYTLVVVPQDRTQIRTNLKAPILINPKHRLGKQTILDGSNYPIQYFLAQDQSQEASHARSNA